MPGTELCLASYSCTYTLGSNCAEDPYEALPFCLVRESVRDQLENWVFDKGIFAMAKEGWSAGMDKDGMCQMMLSYPTATRGDRSPEGHTLRAVHLLPH